MQTNPWGQLFAVLAKQGNQGAARTQKFNPRPAGQLQPGGAPLAVLQFLQANPDRFFTFYQLRLATDRSLKSLDWACLGLRRMGYVETRVDPGNSRYLQYKFKQQPEGDWS